MPIPIFAFEQLPIGEAPKTEEGDVYGSGYAIEDEFNETGAPRSPSPR